MIIYFVVITILANTEESCHGYHYYARYNYDHYHVFKILGHQAYTFMIFGLSGWVS